MAMKWMSAISLPARSFFTRNRGLQLSARKPGGIVVSVLTLLTSIPKLKKMLRDVPHLRRSTQSHLLIPT